MIVELALRNVKSTSHDKHRHLLS